MKIISRSIKTAIRLPFAMAWDVLSLGNMGEGASTGKVLREHSSQKRVDDLLDAIEVIGAARRAAALSATEKAGGEV